MASKMQPLFVDAHLQPWGDEPVELVADPTPPERVYKTLARYKVKDVVLKEADLMAIDGRPVWRYEFIGQKDGKTKVGSCGPVVPRTQWKLIDDEGEEVPRGELGELIVKGDNVILGYWNLPDVTHDVMRGGWFHTGDVARADEDGYIYIVDRIKDMIIRMGENVYPREVEELIYQFPGIHEVAVIGIEDKLRGQVGACFYSVHQGAEVNIRELKQFLQNNLALYKIPCEFHIMDKLPRITTGKIAKKIWEEFQAGISNSR